MSLLSQLFTWWNGQTLATRVHTWRKGEKVGEDTAGNIYYQSENGARRWVIYQDDSEASKVSPEWHGWLHHTWQEPPTKSPIVRKFWEKDHRRNATGGNDAYRPSGSIFSAAPAARSDYDAWSPE